MKILPIEANDADQRLDKFLRKLFPRATRSLIYKLNRKSKIKVSGEDGKFHKQDNEYKLKTGQQVKIFLSDTEFETLSQAVVSESQRTVCLDENRLSKKDIVYEDADLLILNKNPGINVHPGDHKSKEVSIIQLVHDYLGDQLNSLTFQPSLIHRIDRDTSGILMIAKKKSALMALTEAFKKHDRIKKTYYALCYGKFSHQSGTIRKKLLRIENPKKGPKVIVSEDGLTAVTHYQVLGQHQITTAKGTEIVSEVEVRIETGRMHQIRVHLAHIGCPILGDKNYGNKSFNAYIEKQFGLGRQALHAWKIEFFHPTQKKLRKLEARIKKDIQEFISKIQ